MLNARRIIGLLTIMLTVAALCTATQGAGPGSVPFEPPQWSTPEVADVPPDVTSLMPTAVAWDGGALLAGNDLRPQLITSKDLRTWRHTLPDGIMRFTYGPIAAYGPAAYVLGLTTDGAPHVWRTEDGTAWDRVSLAGARPFDSHLSIAAGPQGVVVVGFERESGTSTKGGQVFPGYRVWRSTDGHAFEDAGRIPADGTRESAGTRLNATKHGFLLSNYAASGDIFESSDGVRWAAVGPGIPETIIDAVGRSADTTVALTTWFNTDTTVEGPGLTAYFHRADDALWARGTIDLGTLPDVGVEPRTQQNVRGVEEWGGGFIAYGGTKGGAGVGAVWTSPNGAVWTRMSVRDGGFDQVPLLFAAVVLGDTTALLGMDTSIDGPNLTVWREKSANVPPLAGTSATSTTASASSSDLLARLYEADVPSLCQHPAGKLVNGMMSGIPEIDGYVALLAQQFPDQVDTSVAFGDLTGDGKGDVAAVFGCSQGGVNWPNWIVVYDNQMQIIGAVDLGEATPGEHAEVKRISISDQHVVMNWESYEGAGFCPREWTAQVRIDKQAATVEQLTQVGTTNERGC